MLSKIKYGVVGLGLLALAGCATGAGPVQKISDTCEAIYGALQLAKFAEQDGQVVVSMDTKMAVNKMFAEVVHPICFGDVAVEDSASNQEALQAVLDVLRQIRMGARS